MASVFTLIMNKSLPGHFVWEDERCIAIMTIQPIRAGHLLVIPREEIDQWSDLPGDLAAHLMTISHKIANAMKKVFKAQRIGLMIAGLEVPHTHIHLVPMDSMADLDLAHAKQAEAEDLAQNAAAIRALLGQDS
jgi:histidine triad (HIT) family protein